MPRSIPFIEKGSTAGLVALVWETLQIKRTRKLFRPLVVLIILIIVTMSPNESKEHPCTPHSSRYSAVSFLLCWSFSWPCVPTPHHYPAPPLHPEVIHLLVRSRAQLHRTRNLVWCPCCTCRAWLFPAPPTLPIPKPPAEQKTADGRCATRLLKMCCFSRSVNMRFGSLLGIKPSWRAGVPRLPMLRIHMILHLLFQYVYPKGSNRYFARLTQ